MWIMLAAHVMNAQSEGYQSETPYEIMTYKKPRRSKTFFVLEVTAQSYAFLPLKMRIFDDVIGSKRPYSVYNFTINM